MKKYISPEIIFQTSKQKTVMLDVFGFSDVIADLGEEEEIPEENQ